jgi:hypothetical protein
MISLSFRDLHSKLLRRNFTDSDGASLHEVFETAGRTFMPWCIICTKIVCFIGSVMDAEEIMESCDSGNKPCLGLNWIFRCV